MQKQTKFLIYCKNPFEKYHYDDIIVYPILILVNNYSFKMSKLENVVSF